MPSIGPTDEHLVANACLIHTARAASCIARIFVETAKADKYDSEVENMIKAFHHIY